MVSVPLPLRRAAGFAVGFALLGLLHESGHALVGWATGAPIWEITLLKRKIYPLTLEPVAIPALLSITFGVPPDPFAQGLRTAAGCGITLFAGLAGALRRRARPPAPGSFFDGFSLAVALAGLDLVTYAWIPLLGLPRWIFFGARHSEPAIAAAHLGVPPLALHVGVALVALGTFATLRSGAPSGGETTAEARRRTRRSPPPDAPG